MFNSACLADPWGGFIHEILLLFTLLLARLLLTSSSSSNAKTRKDQGRMRKGMRRDDNDNHQRRLSQSGRIPVTKRGPFAYGCVCVYLSLDCHHLGLGISAKGGITRSNCLHHHRNTKNKYGNVYNAVFSSLFALLQRRATTTCWHIHPRELSRQES